MKDKMNDERQRYKTETAPLFSSLSLSVFGLSLLFFFGLMLFGPKAARASHINLIVIDGTINPAVADFIQENIARARAEGALALVIQLDTPGG